MYTDKSIFQLLKILSDGKIHTYKSLSASLGCTSLSLVKFLQDTFHQDIDINQIRGVGLCWQRPFEWINESVVRSYLSDQERNFNIVIFDLLDSTNSYLLRNKSYYLKDIRTPVVVAELQTRGRGTNNRSWFSDLGGCLTFSILWKFKRNIKYLSSLSLALGVSLIRAFKNISLDNIQLKWPNDIVHNKRKFAGILIECKTNRDGSVTAIIGIGVNLKLSSNIPHCLNYSATDLFQISGRMHSRNQILALLLSELRCVLESFGTDGFSIFRDEWESYHAYQGQSVVLHLSNQDNIEGIVDGVKNDGSLVLITSSGRQHYNIGEISLRTIV
ncbi:biotin--[acetyl-CoA-carboxylase] ligase [Nitrosomonas sp.]|uniref:biotin--[acetyl-CoA-carboxylase] ligase n=1 Tax=Nitrosomonas sp. TaxID=42353 RepID=UPI002082970A|nr:biotin--[acetyl-CoA-carboxylase] ligase [Nitrosomonas sp.]GJL76639.1 MAG: bifunctional ligase/repressor BirA [Nitrosomonas sp.]